jgi:hypothetical protein
MDSLASQLTLDLKSLSQSIAKQLLGPVLLVLVELPKVENEKGSIPFQDLERDALLLLLFLKDLVVVSPLGEVVSALPVALLVLLV